MAVYSKSGAGNLLIYIPGMEGTGSLFYVQEPALARYFTVISLTLPSRLPFDYQSLTADILSILDQENRQNAIIVGESFGGTVALQFAIRYPGRIRHLILCNTFSRLRGRFRLQLAFLLLPLAFNRPGRIIRNWMMRRILASEQIEERDIDRLLECSLSHGYEASRQRLRLIQQHDVRDELKNLPMPVTILAGGRDRLLPSVREGQFLCANITNCRLIVLPEAGHSCFLSRRFSLAALLQENAIL